MSFDGIMTRAIVHELSTQLINGKITKVHQPFPTDLVIAVRAFGKTHRLFISANPSYSRIHITKENYENPKEPPMFCMLLRKHLEGGIIESIEQKSLERIIEVKVKSRDEIGDYKTKRLIIEIMGRHSNITLLDEDKNVIIDCIKHVSLSQNRYRTLQPGQNYIYPPSQGKANPLHTDLDEFIRKLDFNTGKIHMQIVGAFEGLSPNIGKEITHRAGIGKKEAYANAFILLMNDINENNFYPQIVTTEQKEYFSIIDLTFLNGEVKRFESVSELLDRYFFGKSERDQIKQKSNDLDRFIRNEYNKNIKKLEKLKTTLIEARDADRYKLYGELLTAYIYQVKKGDKAVEVINYYDENESQISIPLDPLKTPSDNAQFYFKQYNKAKNSISIVQEQINQTELEIAYFDTLLQQIETASQKDVAEIREELEEQGYLKQRKKRKKPMKQSGTPQLEHYISSDGTDMYVGKNNKQNDYLTNKYARSTDTWLHTKDIPGSHVVIRGSTPNEATLNEAANIAAYFSKARSSSSVPVDYTLIKHVKKPSGAKPGYVIYEQQKTIYVTPSEDIVYALRKNK
jgi:predicted ribosome quality control (RQC) complex YloA/Tae2 family protein